MRQDWKKQLADYLESKKGHKFVWGVSDCVSLTLNAITAMTGDDQHLKLIKWHTAKQARTIFQESMSPDSYLNGIKAQPIKLQAAATGDIITGFDKACGFPTCGVVCGTDYVSSWFDEGVYSVPLIRIYQEAGDCHAWRIVS